MDKPSSLMRIHIKVFLVPVIETNERKMETEDVTDMREETVRELERLRREVKTAKEDLRVRIEYYFRVLRDKHIELVEQLEEVVHLAETQAEERQVKLNQLKITKAEVLHNLQHNELNETLVNLSRELDEKIQGLEATVDQIPSVWLEWRDEWLEGGMAGLCRLCKCVSYVNRHNPVWSGVNKGGGQKEICNPAGLSIDRDSGNIFVCDYLSARIQVFGKEGNYLRTIEPQGMTLPSFIALSLHHLFVSCEYPHSIYKLDKVSGDILCCVQTEYAMSGLSVDTDTLYVGVFGNNAISHFSVEDLLAVNMTSLNSPHITQDTSLIGLQLVPSLFVVLFKECTYPVQSFSRDGNLIHLIVSQEQLISAEYFCLDRHRNIIISDTGAHSVKVFDREGQLVATIGDKGTGPGMFNGPRGIKITNEGHIVVVDSKQSHKLQIF